MGGLFSGAVLMAVATLAGQVRTSSTSGDAYAQAREAFEQGLSLLDKKDFAGAAAAFERSRDYRESPSTLYNLGIAYRGLGANRKAAAAIERYLATAPPGAKDAARARALLEQVRRGLVEVTVSVSGGGGRVEVDGEVVATGDGEHRVWVDPGTRSFALVRTGRTVKTRAFDAHLGEPGALDLDAVEPDLSAHEAPPRIEAPVESTEPIYERWWFWAGIAVVVVAAAVGGAAIAASSSKPDRGTLGFTLQGLER
jgi:hypothetical protein